MIFCGYLLQNLFSCGFDRITFNLPRLACLRIQQAVRKGRRPGYILTMQMGNWVANGPRNPGYTRYIHVNININTHMDKVHV